MTTTELGFANALASILAGAVAMGWELKSLGRSNSPWWSGGLFPVLVFFAIRLTWFGDAGMIAGICSGLLAAHVMDWRIRIDRPEEQR